MHYVDPLHESTPKAGTVQSRPFAYPLAETTPRQGRTAFQDNSSTIHWPKPITCSTMIRRFHRLAQQTVAVEPLTLDIWSSRTTRTNREFHPKALTDPYVTLSRHTALHSCSLFSFENKPYRKERDHPEHPVGRTLRRAMSCSSLSVHHRRFNATIG
jgi:hypothetical protein